MAELVCEHALELVDLSTCINGSPIPITRRLLMPIMPPRCVTKALTALTMYTSAGIA
jgi:hypothetical protein